MFSESDIVFPHVAYYHVFCEVYDLFHGER